MKKSKIGLWKNINEMHYLVKDNLEYIMKYMNE